MFLLESELRMEAARREIEMTCLLVVLKEWVGKVRGDMNSQKRRELRIRETEERSRI